MNSIKLDGKNAFALYSMPNQEEAHLVLNSNGSESESIDLNSIEEESGFVFAPFINSNKAEIIKGNRIKLIDLNKLIYSYENEENINFNRINFSTYSEAFYNYLNAFDETFQKAILSRPIDIPVPKDLNPIELFKTLNEKYSSAFVSLIYTSNQGLWLGATPEMLLFETEDDYQTVALAGTLPYQKQVEWGDKEIKEQAIVVDYIKQQLDSLEIQCFKSEARTVQAGNLAHLNTDFLVSKNVEFSELLNILHPTPAVCGMPKGRALELILENELYDRELYTGFIGPSFEETHLFVNLRCMQLFKEKARIYVGGGITKDSELEIEWEETELKAQTILSILENNRTLHP